MLKVWDLATEQSVGMSHFYIASQVYIRTKEHFKMPAAELRYALV